MDTAKPFFVLLIVISNNFNRELFGLNLIVAHNLVIYALCGVITNMFAILLHDIWPNGALFRKGYFVVENYNAQLVGHGNI